MKESVTTEFLKNFAKPKEGDMPFVAIPNKHGLEKLWFWIGRRGLPLILIDPPNIQSREKSITICKN